MQFYEKENIFEKYLPYAIAFGLTQKWIQAFRGIYGVEAANAYVPAWYVGSSGSFDFNSFGSNMNSISSQMGSVLTSSPSGSSGSGGGFSGGGGGGGGGGSW